MLQVDRINVFYGDIQALREVSLSVSSGEIISLLGGNGAGKTTTLKTISGLLHPASGSITFDGSKIHQLPAHCIVEMGISQVPEGRRIFPRMSVLENLHMGSHVSEARKRREETLNLVFQFFPILRERSGQFGGTLSGGEQQMLAIARALISNPLFLLMDEPTEGLAPVLVREVGDAILKLKQSGLSIFLVEQNLSFAKRFADYAHVMSKGKIVYSSTPTELWENREIKERYLGV